MPPVPIPVPRINLAKCFGDISGSLPHLPELKVVLGRFQDFDFKYDLDLQLKNLCAMRETLAAKLARIQGLRLNLGLVIPELKLALSAKFCPEISELLDCLQNYDAVLERMETQINLPSIDAYIAQIQSDDDVLTVCGKKAAKWKTFIV